LAYPQVESRLCRDSALGALHTDQYAIQNGAPFALDVLGLDHIVESHDEVVTLPIIGFGYANRQFNLKPTHFVSVHDQEKTTSRVGSRLCRDSALRTTHRPMRHSKRAQLALDVLGLDHIVENRDEVVTLPIFDVGRHTPTNAPFKTRSARVGRSWGWTTSWKVRTKS
jgi:hypothetical protein